MGGPAGAHAQSWSASRVDSHAPLGVMGDHTHEAGEWMLSFRSMRVVMDGNRTDTARVPADGVLVDYPVTPLRMPMDMYMVGAMYAPTDRLTLVGMVPVLGISMDHRTRTGVEFTTESGGIGDVQMSALVGVAARARQRVHLHLGVSAPTGSINERGETPAATNVQLPYPMQVGGGTWNVLPGLTYLARPTPGHGRAGPRDRASWRERVRLRARPSSLDDRVVLKAALRERQRLAAAGRRQVGQHLRCRPQNCIREWCRRLTRPDAPAAVRTSASASTSTAPATRCQGIALRWKSWVPVYQTLAGPQLETDWTWASAGRRPSRPEHGALGLVVSLWPARSLLNVLPELVQACANRAASVL